MTLLDAVLVLLLAANIHETDEGVRKAARSVVKRLPRSKRDPIYRVINSDSPLQYARLIAETLGD